MRARGTHREHQIPRKRKILLALSAALLASIITVVLGELLLGIFSPQRTMSPRREFSEEYGFMNYQSTKRVHEQRGKWRFIYTTNQHRNRGELVPISNEFDVPNIVVLGDSFSFGTGVNDGEEYSAKMSTALKGQYNVINLSVGGWGLTQHIRRYYEFGQLYSPEVVLLQFELNDLDDNFNNRVTVIENGRFKFVNSNSNVNLIKKYLSDSIIQKSQIYNLLRDSVYIYFAQRNVEAAVDRASDNQGIDANEVPTREQFYNELLELFATDLKRRGGRFMMISTNNKLDRAPHVKKKVLDLAAGGLVEYVEVVEFFDPSIDYASPEGHRWGKEAHRILGEELSEIILSSGN